MSLRVLQEPDLEAFNWLPEVARATGAVRWTNADALAQAVDDANVLTNENASALIAVRPESPRTRNATVEFLAVSPGARRLGIGGRTALALERRLRTSYDAVYVQVPSSIGLALYFWLRLGYGPLTKQDWPSTPESGDTCAWMKRDIS